MAATSIYNLDYPISTDLVANGATAMQLLAGDVETALLAQTQAASGGFRNQLRNPTFSQAQLPAGTTGVADYWTYYVDSITGVTNTRNTLAITAGVPEWVTGSMTQATASNAAGIARYVALQNTIPEVRALSGQTVVVSFYAKATAGTPKVGINLTQYFGTGGTPSADVAGTGQAVTISTSWARYSATFSVASASGKTLGTAGDDGTILRLWTSAGSNYNTQTGSIGLQTSTIEITGVQVELSYLSTLELRTPERNWQMASRFGVWQSWTPQLKQGAAGMTTTITYAAYCIIGKTCIAQCNVSAGANGTAGQVIELLSNGTLPTPKQALSTSTCGLFLYDDIGTGVNVGAIRLQSGTGQPLFRLFSDTGAGSRTTPTISTGANTDSLYINAVYEIA